MYFKIKELKVNEEGETGVQAISFVDKPAIETDFEYFAKGNIAQVPYFKYIGPDDDVTRPFCKNKIGQVYHVSEIQGWGQQGNPEYTELMRQEPNKTDTNKYHFVNAPVENSNFFLNFNDNGGPDYTGSYNYSCDSQMFGCRHKLVRATKSEVPANKRHFEPNIQFAEQHFVKMEMLSEPKKRGSRISS